MSYNTSIIPGNNGGHGTGGGHGIGVWPIGFARENLTGFFKWFLILYFPTLFISGLLNFCFCLLRSLETRYIPL